MLRLNVFMELKLTSIGRLFQALTTIDHVKAGKQETFKQIVTKKFEGYSTLYDM